MDPAATLRLAGCTRLPRASGDGPQVKQAITSAVSAAPRERGWTLRAPQVLLLSGGCPGRAGTHPTVYTAATTGRAASKRAQVFEIVEGVGYNPARDEAADDR